MPRNVRNFWIELTVDGKKTRVATGPVRKDGGFELTVKARNEGGIVEVLSLWGRANGDALSVHGDGALMEAYGTVRDVWEGMR